MVKISGILGKFKVSIGNLTQSDISDNDCAQIIIITHKTCRENLERVLKQFNATKFIVKSKVVKIKMEL
ncbi:MAG: ACT domain-containing protein [Endomicrobium sp.]|nr:ACT domain-containing protein [Endomicrobium sp.]